MKTITPGHRYELENFEANITFWYNNDIIYSAEVDCEEKSSSTNYVSSQVDRDVTNDR